MKCDFCATRLFRCETTTIKCLSAICWHVRSHDRALPEGYSMVAEYHDHYSVLAACLLEFSSLCICAAVDDGHTSGHVAGCTGPASALPHPHLMMAMPPAYAAAYLHSPLPQGQLPWYPQQGASAAFPPQVWESHRGRRMMMPLNSPACACILSGKGGESPASSPAHAAAYMQLMTVSQPACYDGIAVQSRAPLLTAAFTIAMRKQIQMCGASDIGIHMCR